jgi:uncharacterized protein (TIGR03382 family)
LPLSASAAVLWRGDFETGDRSQWNGIQEVNSNRLLVQSDKVKEGKYALKATVILGDNPIGASGNRNELVDSAHYEKEGAERWYHWYTYFDEGYPSERTWQVFTQWHQYEDHGSPPMEFDVYGEEIQLTNWEKIVWRAPLQRGVWHEFLFHVKWSKDSSKGFVELWYDGQVAIPKTSMNTDSNVYMKQGLYRNNTIQGVGIVYHDGMTVGETREDVMPATTPPATDPNAGGTATTGGTGTTGTGTTGTGTTGGGATTGPTTPTTPSGPNNTYASDQQSAGCSATGGAMFPFAGMLLAIGMLARRKKALAAAKKQ